MAATLPPRLKGVVGVVVGVEVSGVVEVVAAVEGVWGAVVVGHVFVYAQFP